MDHLRPHSVRRCHCTTEILLRIVLPFLGPLHTSTKVGSSRPDIIWLGSIGSYLNLPILHHYSIFARLLIEDHLPLEGFFKAHGLYLPLLSTSPIPPFKLFPLPGTLVFRSGLPFLCFGAGGLAITAIPAPYGALIQTTGALPLLNTFSAMKGVSQGLHPS